MRTEEESGGAERELDDRALVGAHLARNERRLAEEAAALELVQIGRTSAGVRRIDR